MTKVTSAAPGVATAAPTARTGVTTKGTAAAPGIVTKVTSAAPGVAPATEVTTKTTAATRMTTKARTVAPSFVTPTHCPSGMVCIMSYKIALSLKCLLVLLGNGIWTRRRVQNGKVR